MSQPSAVSRVRGQFKFTVDGLCLTGDMLSRRLGPVRSGDLTAWICLPAVPFDSETHPDGPGLVEVEEFVVDLVKVLSPPRVLPVLPGDSGSPQSGGPEAEALHDALAKIASVVARDFLTWVRVGLRQQWVTPTGMPSPELSQLSDADSWDVFARHDMPQHRPVPFTMLETLSASVVSGPHLDPRLRKVLAGSLRARGDAGAAGHGGTGLPERLLASAAGKLRSHDPDPQAAVFLAAAACETKVKTVLRARVAASQRPLLEFILDNPRDMTVSAINHFHRLSKTVMGRSLQEDSRAAGKKNGETMWKRLEALITARNGVAHRGLEPTTAKAEGHVSTALDVFAWLDTVPGAGRSSP